MPEFCPHVTLGICCAAGERSKPWAWRHPHGSRSHRVSRGARTLCHGSTGKSAVQLDSHLFSVRGGARNRAAGDPCSRPVGAASHTSTLAKDDWWKRKWRRGRRSVSRAFGGRSPQLSQAIARNEFVDYLHNRGAVNGNANDLDPHPVTIREAHNGFDSDVLAAFRSAKT